MPIIEIPRHALSADRPNRVEDGGQGIVVVRHATGFAAYPDICPHAKWRLSDGELNNGVLECPGHAWEFDAATGACLTVPAHCLRRLALTEDDGRVTIESDY